MFNFKTKFAAAAIAVAAAASSPPRRSPANAPTPGANALANAPTMPKDVTDTVDRRDRPRSRKSTSTAASCAPAAWLSSRAASSRSTATRTGRR